MYLQLIRKDLKDNTQRGVGVATNLGDADRKLAKLAKREAKLLNGRGNGFKRYDGYIVTESDGCDQSVDIALYTFEEPTCQQSE